MVKRVPGEALDTTFAALADPTRRGILAALTDGSRSVGELAAPLPMSLVAVSKHISVLERAGLVRRARSGRRQVCTVTAEPLREAAAWLEWYHQFWTTRLDAIEHYLATEDE
jgi:DNA-binding transcriptional ArsR family regulator